MNTKFDVGDTLYLPVTVAEIKILENSQELYKVNVPGCGPCFWYSPEDFLVFNSQINFSEDIVKDGVLANEPET